MRTLQVRVDLFDFFALSFLLHYLSLTRTRTAACSSSEFTRSNSRFPFTGSPSHHLVFPFLFYRSLSLYVRTWLLIRFILTLCTHTEREGKLFAVSSIPNACPILLSHSGTENVFTSTPLALWSLAFLSLSSHSFLSLQLDPFLPRRRRMMCDSG